MILYQHKGEIQGNNGTFHSATGSMVRPKVFSKSSNIKANRNCSKIIWQGGRARNPQTGEASTTTLQLKVWFEDQLFQYHRGTCQYAASQPCQICWTKSCILIRSPHDLDAYSSLQSTGPTVRSKLTHKKQTTVTGRRWTKELSS